MNATYQNKDSANLVSLAHSQGFRKYVLYTQYVFRSVALMTFDEHLGLIITPVASAHALPEGWKPS